MMFTQRVETVGGIKDFLAPSPAKGKRLSTSLLAGLGVGVLATLLPTTQAAPQAMPVMGLPMPILGSIGVADKIIRACDPIIQLIQGVSYPVGFIMITAGFLVIMTGNRQKGLNIIKWAAIGYIGMQFAPAIMAILVEVGRAMGR
jgi:hypothetical protein